MPTNELKYNKFRRLATSRTNEIIKKLKLLGNLSNKKVYEYSKQDADKIFAAINKELKLAKIRFRSAKETQFKL